MRGKKGEELPLETVLFFILNTAFILMLLFFVARSAESVYVYEQTYVKQIALALDAAEPEMTFVIDMTTGEQLAKKHGQNPEAMVRVDEQTGSVWVQLTPEHRGYRYQYFSSHDINVSLERGFLRIQVARQS